MAVWGCRARLEGWPHQEQEVRTRVYNGPMHDVVVYSRKGCHLYDLVKESLTQVQRDADFQWHEVDIDVSPQLRQEYNDEVPVVFIDGRKAFKYRMDGREFLRVLAGR
jgi:glutaredoxin